MEKVLDLALALAVFAGVVSTGALVAGWLYDSVGVDDSLSPRGRMARRRDRSPRARWARLRRWWVGD